MVASPRIAVARKSTAIWLARNAAPAARVAAAWRLVRSCRRFALGLLAKTVTAVLAAPAHRAVVPRPAIVARRVASRRSVHALAVEKVALPAAPIAASAVGIHALLPVAATALPAVRVDRRAKATAATETRLVRKATGRVVHRVRVATALPFRVVIARKDKAATVHRVAAHVRRVTVAGVPRAAVAAATDAAVAVAVVAVATDPAIAEPRLSASSRGH